MGVGYLRQKDRSRSININVMSLHYVGSGKNTVGIYAIAVYHDVIHGISSV